MSGVLSTAQQVGNSIGVAVTGLLFFGALGHGYSLAFERSVLQMGTPPSGGPAHQADAGANIRCKVATPPAVERTSSTIVPASSSAAQLAHGQH